MMDREKVIKGIRACIMHTGTCSECPYCHQSGKLCGADLYADIMELLKGQKVVVLCKECEHYRWDDYCEYNCHSTTPDWWCCDGVKRDD